jgi:hypothetical protein
MLETGQRSLTVEAVAHGVVCNGLVATVAGIGVAVVPRVANEPTDGDIAGKILGELRAEPPTQQRERPRAGRRRAAGHRCSTKDRSTTAETLGAERLRAAARPPPTSWAFPPARRRQRSLRYCTACRAWPCRTARRHLRDMPWLSPSRVERHRMPSAVISGSSAALKEHHAASSLDRRIMSDFLFWPTDLALCHVPEQTADGAGNARSRM